ncbi:hypothetical protein LXA43DRAFT_735285 [Ganoderma leucocontextum]|nr:hypothetical protein LXA43DRAFT_735285 [Ganoderma leucocontextum]
MAYYENDRLEADSRHCRLDGEACSRCTIKASPICCSLCSPSHSLFAILPSMDEQPAKPSTSRASQVEASYTMTAADLELRAALHAFRRQQTQAKLGSAHLKNLGPGAIMGDQVLKRILDCARVHKIETVEQLYRETKWNRALEFGENVLKLIAVYVSLSALPFCCSLHGDH